ncbi:MAG: hypothetical protein NC314_10270 [Roseburia sp.]|nr:hypothetical protein [Ruminococcus sp.]MCM1155104.1 hypothetical protein [Roseburia sp.]MCM1243216.1 hypothetical protein [Roseburia sp.]
MKKYRHLKLWTALGLVFCMLMMPMVQMDVRAAEVIATVQGTVMTGTTSELIKLSTKEGEMQIKLDSTTDTSGCKILLPDQKISVSVSHGSDGYLHAVSITSGSQTIGVTLDNSKTATVTGTISEKTKGDVLYFNTSAGEMQIKLDSSTNMSGCSVLVANKSYTITCVRGSDAYMHAVSISDSSAAAIGTSGMTGYTPAPAGAVNASTTVVTGTVGNNTKENLLYLATSSGEMQIVIDGNTDSRNGLMLIPGRALTVSVYRGSDAYMHAAAIAGVKDYVQPATVTGSYSTVTGTVNSKSTENILYLSTSAGEMELKLDTLNSVSNCKVLVNGKKITVTCARGSDAYMHAISITGN